MPYDVAAFQAASADQQAEGIRLFVAANINDPAAIANAAELFGVSTQQLASATGYSTDQVGAYLATAATPASSAQIDQGWIHGDQAQQVSYVLQNQASGVDAQGFVTRNTNADGDASTQRTAVKLANGNAGYLTIGGRVVDSGYGFNDVKGDSLLSIAAQFTAAAVGAYYLAAGAGSLLGGDMVATAAAQAAGDSTIADTILATGGTGNVAAAIPDLAPAWTASTATVVAPVISVTEGLTAAPLAATEGNLASYAAAQAAGDTTIADTIAATGGTGNVAASVPGLAEAYSITTLPADQSSWWADTPPGTVEQTFPAAAATVAATGIGAGTAATVKGVTDAIKGVASTVGTLIGLEALTSSKGPGPGGSPGGGAGVFVTSPLGSQTTKPAALTSSGTNMLLLAGLAVGGLAIFANSKG